MQSNKIRRCRGSKYKLQCVLSISLMILSTFLVARIPPAHASCSSSSGCPFGRYFDYEVFVIMENTDLSEITSAGGYMSSLMNANSAATHLKARTLRGKHTWKTTRLQAEQDHQEDAILVMGALETMLRDITHLYILATLSIPSHDAPR